MPPHKPLGAQSAGDRRAAWLEAAVAGVPGLVVSRAELDREGPSYTADTLEAIARDEPGARLWFVLGADQLAGLPGWHEPERILAAARGRNAGATSRCTSSVSAALQTPGRCVFALTAIASAFSRSAGRST